jgi:hypothetical protein
MRIRHKASADKLLKPITQDSLVLHFDRVQSSEQPMIGGFFVFSLKEYASSTVLKT